jgi:hypothetical protein
MRSGRAHAGLGRVGILVAKSLLLECGFRWRHAAMLTVPKGVILVVDGWYVSGF